MQMANRIYTGVFVIAVITFHACAAPGPGLFTRKSAHEQYGQRLTDAGLKSSALAQLWFQAGDHSLSAPLAVTLPYKEAGYFAAERPSASGVRFAVKKGEKISIALEKNPVTGFTVFYDVWAATDNKPALLAAGDTTGNRLELDIKDNGNYIVRVQPELLKGGEYTLTITAGPSLAFPIPSSIKHNIGSLWGVGRDNGARRHEGIDIFAPVHSPAIACADGMITSVTENGLGGKVVFMRPDNKSYVLYYAHLDSQLVTTGQAVRKGDTLGLTGNTGNARFTPSHLHFGIYTSGGATDPLPFVNPVVKEPARISASLANLGKQVRSTGRSKLYSEPDAGTQGTALPDGALLLVDAASAGWYKVMLPGGQAGFVKSADVQGLNVALRRITLRSALPLYDGPDTGAAKKITLPAGKQMNVLGLYKDFYFISSSDTLSGWVTKQAL